MDLPDNNGLTIAIPKSNSYHSMKNGLSFTHSAWFEIRLFYVRVSPCVVDDVPNSLTVHFRREIGVSLEINGAVVPASDLASITLRRDRINKETLEVTYLTTDSIKITGGMEFEVLEDGGDVIICGLLERLESPWVNGGSDNNGWSMESYTAAGLCSGSSAFVQPKLGVSAPSFEVYIAGCCSGVPVILTKMIQVSPRRKAARCGMLEAIPESDEVDREQKNGNAMVRFQKLQIANGEADEYDPDAKYGHGLYSEDMYTGEDGQLSWFNAGVRVGVGIGLGVCLGVGIGVGLMMRSYQATTRNFRRRFL